MSGKFPTFMGRRGALFGMGLLAGGALGLSSRGRAATTSSPGRPTDDHALRGADAEVRALFGELVPGTSIASTERSEAERGVAVNRGVRGGFPPRMIEAARLEAVHALRAGAIPVVLSVGGTRFALEIFRHEPEALRSVALAGPLALMLVNRGDGRRQTPEDVGLGVMALARALEARVAAGAPIPPGLRTQRERALAHPTGIFHVPLG